MQPAFWTLGGLVILATGCAEHKTIYPTQPAPVYVPPSQPAAPRPSQPAGATLPPPPTRLQAANQDCVGTPPPDAVARAKAAFQAGQTAFNQGDYPTAIRLWRESYRQDCMAVAMLLNLARAQELNGDRQGAAQSLRTYLRRRPEAPDRQQVEARIQNLER